VILERLSAAVGATPLVRLRSLEREVPGVALFAKLEWLNPGGSVKDRPALSIFSDAIARGRLEPGGRRALLDSTSGNTGIAYAWIGAALGIGVVLVMPGNVSEARRRITRAHGAQQLFSDPLELSDGAMAVARRLAADEPDRFFYADQYANPANPAAHQATAAEIWGDTDGRVTHFVAGLGTTGTCVGTGRALRAQNPAIEVVAVEPAEPLHGLEGLRHLASSTVPPIFDPSVPTRRLTVTTDEGWEMAERLASDEGLLAGQSAGAAAAGALEVARDLWASGRGGCVVALFPDRADRYLPPA
jgi:cysteine synthase B